MSKSILVVDDDRLVTELVKRVLQDKGYEVVTAGDGREALQTLKTVKPDLILLDVQMPNMDGYAFILEKSHNPALAPIPFIVLTASEKTEPIFKHRGAQDYLLKPIQTEDLLKKIQTILPL